MKGGLKATNEMLAEALLESAKKSKMIPADISFSSSVPGGACVSQSSLSNDQDTVPKQLFEDLKEDVRRQFYARDVTDVDPKTTKMTDKTSESRQEHVNRIAKANRQRAKKSQPKDQYVLSRKRS